MDGSKGELLAFDSICHRANTDSVCFKITKERRLETCFISTDHEVFFMFAQRKLTYHEMRAIYVPVSCTKSNILNHFCGCRRKTPKVLS